MALEHGQIGLDVMPDLENAWVLEHGFQESERMRPLPAKRSLEP
jgi:hypothetical protein